MISIEELQERVTKLMSENSKMAGKMSAICGYLDAAGVPNVSKTQNRVKLMTIMYDQMRLENKRLVLMLEDQLANSLINPANNHTYND